MSERVFYNAINTALESGYKTMLNIFEASGGSWEKAWRSVSDEERRGIRPEDEWERMKKLGVRLVLRNDAEFPALTREIPWPPFGIYIEGSIPESKFSCAVVGTRKATSEGRSIAKRFSRTLAERGVSVMSGLALGIDAAAHEGCLDGGGGTAAVLANGLGAVYPKMHHSLAKKIVGSGGALISEYPPGAPPLAYRFLERNRIISGLARGTLVVEAPERSGSLVTARFALDQNRDVFVIPGPISHPNFSGSNRLVRSGAQLVTRPEDILESLGVDIETETEGARKFESEEERLVCEALKKLSRPADADTIMEITGLSVADANTALSFLVIKNIVKETEGGYTLAK